MSDTNFTIPSDFADCFFIFHSAEDENGFADSLYARPLKGFRRKDNTTESFDFFGIRGSSYGTKVPAGTAGWALVHNNDGELTTLANGTIPEPGLIQKVELSDGRVVHVRRAQINFFFSVTAKPAVFRKIPLKTFNTEG